MGVLKNFCQQTRMRGFYELCDSKSKICKAIWLVAVGFAIVLMGGLIFNAAKDFIKQPVRIIVEHEESYNVPYPPLKFCYMHWIAWVEWKTVVENFQFSKSELLYAMSYITENIYSSEFFNCSEVEASVKSKLYSLNKTLIDFYEEIAEPKSLVTYDDLYYAGLRVVRKPYHHDVFDLHHQMCYFFKEETVRKLLKQPNNNHRFEVYSQYPYYDDHKSYLADAEFANLVQDFVKEWRLSDVDYNDKFPIMFYPDGHGSNFILLERYDAAHTVEFDMSTYRKISSKHSKDINESCDIGQKSLMAANITSFDDCIEKSRKKILQENNAEEPWLGFTESISPKKIHFLDKTGNIIENATCIRRHKLEYLYNGKKQIEGMRKKTRQIVDVCADKSGNGCEMWDIEFNVVKASPNGKETIYVNYPKVDQITIMKEIDAQTWSRFIGEVGGVLGIWTGASVVIFFQIFHLCFSCCGETN